jgi:hypothetical protein
LRIQEERKTERKKKIRLRHREAQRFAKKRRSDASTARPGASECGAEEKTEPLRSG